MQKGENMQHTEQHIDYAVVAKTHPAMYKMHKYWSRKPYNVIADYIKHYTKKGDIILDPFCGSGVTAIEAIRLKRKVIAVDLNPMAIFITKMTLEPINLAKFEWAFQDLKNNKLLTVKRRSLEVINFQKLLEELRKREFL